MIASFLRILLGFVFACLAAAMTKVAFVITPADILALGPDAQLERLARAGALILAVATQSAIFALPFAAIAIGLAHWLRIRGWPYYGFAGLLISLLGFAALYASEPSGIPTIANAYAVAAYLFAGVIGGYVYWVIAGRVAGRRSPPPKPDFVARRGEARDGNGEGRGATGESAPQDERLAQVKLNARVNGTGSAPRSGRQLQA
ncbi:membrane protein of unknown function [Candidatus Filomicrobium marinum]|uniref:Uncharacterized protein n=2 Tax=Candidatus Filomicrobium marinum TaxID=1608628 RepID=A0A0D6JD03_9HYPH|nr:hypothetical protein [Candidatus Filomicrobium marinum]CFX07702.1 membrane protein of unknown function [Candidatus Filomicrobium marinum]CPR16661.1 membrane protein of unknown function [Candidatus Filomicrobium marinum]